MKRLGPQRMRDLVEAAATVAGQADLAALLRASVATAMDLTGARYGALGVIGDQGGLSEFVHRGIAPKVVVEIGDPPKGHGVLGTITRLGQTVRLDDIADHPDSVGFPENHPPMKAFLGVPVRAGETVFGNLYLTEKDGGFSESDEALVEFLAVTAGAAVSTLRLQERLRRVALQEDRERIARDLHDSLIQDLFAVGLSLQSSLAQLESDPEAVRDRIDSAMDQLDAAIGSLRRFIFDLRPPRWARRDLEADIRLLVADLSRPHRVAVEVDIDPAAAAVDAETTGHLVAIVREALSNALRHARARRITIRVSAEPDRVVAAIADDGEGFDASAARGGLGLGNIARRAAEAGGRHTVESSPGSGTTVRVEMPRSRP
ncbi:MAG: GAF domain-containing sensor histidine kinase [Acidimicrobiia bacterium]